MGQCILVVEDQEDNRQILRDLLTFSGFEIVEATDGAQALDAITTRRPDRMRAGSCIAASYQASPDTRESW